ncbi:MAG: protein kinase [Acidobacteriota bacterium]
MADDAPTVIQWRTSSGSVADGDTSPPERIGRYRILGELGRGGMGVVWRGVDDRLDRPVALKTLRESLLREPQHLERFLAEARLLASLNHPHLAIVHDLPLHEDRPVLVMELLEGENLAIRLARGPLPVGEALELGIQVASGLAAAHERGIVHRDLKPANVQVLPTGDVKVLDFGLARSWSATSDDREERLLAGTPGYMSPEQVRCEPLDGRADLFSFGLVLYECLTGLPAFQGKDTQELILAPVQDEPDWSSLPGSTPAGLRELVTSCLEKNVDDRPRRAGEVVTALRRLRGRDDDGEGRDRAARSLPSENDSFVGREQEMSALSRSIDAGHALISVLGAGGCGKTRLVLHHVLARADDASESTWFFDLSEARDVDGIAHVLASTLDVPLGPGDPIEQLTNAIAAMGGCLLVLDNFEQVAQHAEATVGRWLRHAQDATFIVTSRTRLDLPGEEILALDPLPSEGAGVELFELRARAKQPDFVVDDDNRALVEKLVGLLDGMPLAIELAAARSRVLSPAQLIERMKDRFRLLSGGGSTSRRQATLRATIDWSWDLLEPWEKSALAQASVFEGDFTLESAEAVLDLTAWAEAPWPLDVVQALVEKSLLRTWTPPSIDGSLRDEPCFKMHVSIQEYAAEKLRTPEALPDGNGGPETERAAFLRHGERYARFGTEDALATLTSHGGDHRRLALAREGDNLLAACRRALERRDGETAAGAFLGAWHALVLHAPMAMAAELGRRVLAVDTLGARSRARLLNVLAFACLYQGRLQEALTTQRSAVTIARELGDRRLEGRLLDVLGFLVAESGDDAGARELHASALRLARETADRRTEAMALRNLARRHPRDDHGAETLRLLDEALASFREVGDRLAEGQTIGDIAWEQADLGRLEEARVGLKNALAIHEEIDDWRSVAQARSMLGNLLGRLGELDEAREELEASLALHRRLGGRNREGQVLHGLGCLHVDRGAHDEARACFEQALTIVRSNGDRPFEAITLGSLARLDLELGRLEEARQSLETALLLRRELGDRRSQAQLLVQRARLELEDENRQAARACLDELEAIIEAGGSGVEQLAAEAEELRNRLGSA